MTVVSRWLFAGNRTFSEVASMVVTWWIVALCAVMRQLQSCLDGLGSLDKYGMQTL